MWLAKQLLQNQPSSLSSSSTFSKGRQTPGTGHRHSGGGRHLGQISRCWSLSLVPHGTSTPLWRIHSPDGFRPQGKARNTHHQGDVSGKVLELIQTRLIPETRPHWAASKTEREGKACRLPQGEEFCRQTAAMLLPAADKENQHSSEESSKIQSSSSWHFYCPE